MPGAQAITKRDAWSKTFEDIVSLDTMRTDCPTTLPDVPDGYSNIHPSLRTKQGEGKGKGKNRDTWWIRGQQPTSQFQRNLATAAASLCDVELEDLDKFWVNQNTCGNFLRRCMHEFKSKSINK